LQPSRAPALRACPWPSLRPEAAHLRRNVDAGRLGGWLWRRHRRQRRPEDVVEMLQHRLGDEAGALRIDVTIAARVLAVRIETLRHDEVELVPRARHRHVE